MSDEEGTGYDADYMPVLELIWGKGFIAPGGEGNVDRIVEGVDLQDKSVLELGSGAGGGTLVLAGSGGGSGNFDDDIIYTNGQFVQWPEGLQQ